MRRTLLLAALCAQALVASARFSLNEVPGVYRLKSGSAKCDGDLVITRTNGGQILGSNIRGNDFGCQRGAVTLLRGNTESGNELTKFLARSSASMGEFIVGRIVTDITCGRRNGGQFKYPRGQIWNFVEPRRRVPINFMQIFRDQQAGLNFQVPSVYTFRRGREYLIIGNQCLYRKSWFVCFPESATVGLEGGGRKRMDEVRVGDRVSVGNGEYSDVFMWTHNQKTDEPYPFVRLETAAGAKLTLTAGHYLRAGGELKPAGEVEVGDTVTLEDGAMSDVVRISHVHEYGFYNPQTLHGDIAVDGVVASTYTEAIAPAKAHAILAPVRVLYKAMAALRPVVSR